MKQIDHHYVKNSKKDQTDSNSTHENATESVTNDTIDEDLEKKEGIKSDENIKQVYVSMKQDEMAGETTDKRLKAETVVESINNKKESISYDEEENKNLENLAVLDREALDPYSESGKSRYTSSEEMMKSNEKKESSVSSEEKNESKPKHSIKQYYMTPKSKNYKPSSSRFGKNKYFTMSKVDCHKFTLPKIEDTVWKCDTRELDFGSTCFLQCTEDDMILEYHLSTVCSPEGWFPMLNQVGPHWKDHICVILI